MDHTRPTFHGCDYCGSNATHTVRDMRRTNGPDALIPQYEEHGRTRAGCAAHPVESRTYLQDGVTLEGAAS